MTYMTPHKGGLGTSYFCGLKMELWLKLLTSIHFFLETPFLYTLCTQEHLFPFLDALCTQKIYLHSFNIRLTLSLYGVCIFYIIGMIFFSF